MKNAPTGTARGTAGSPTGAGHAVVMGAGMAGLAMAQALLAGFDRVTVVERDRLPAGAGHRRGVPQDRHLHLLLPAGASALEELFPGLGEELRHGGALFADTDRLRLCLNGHRLAPGRSGEHMVLASRPFVEATVRRRVAAEPSVSVREGDRVSGLAVSDGGDRVSGVELHASSRDVVTEHLPAELVVDCSGRGTPVPRWLDELGYQPPAVDELDVQVRYVTRRYELPDDVLDGDHHVLIGPARQDPRGGAMTNVEDGTWLVTLFSMGGEPVPRDEEAFARFAAELPIDDIHRAIRTGAPVGEPSHYRFPANRRVRYEQLGQLPDGLLGAGDAVCSFNPIYGQGMSVAAIEARELQRRLRAGSRPSPGTWFAAAARIVDTAWQLAIGGDLHVDAVEGHRPLVTRARNLYLDRIQAAAVDDPRLTERIVRVLGLVDPPTRLLRPRIVAGALRPRR
jgi:2-polyprenyl-6-methoxyphenol hydroxylase-like FAD-dependent oxidoreductase